MADGMHLRLLTVFALSSLAVLASDDGKASVPSTPEKTVAAPALPAGPPVLRRSEPADSGVVMLPGPAPARVFIAPPVPQKNATLAETLGPPPPELNDPGRPILHRAPRPVYPSEFEKDAGIFCQLQIGHWTDGEAMALLGMPSASRPAYDDDQKVNGRIYAFVDPTSRYRLLELDFDGDTGALRTVFVYPWKMTWMECRKTWGGAVSAADANQGRKFYSYVNRRLDVLVDATGKVVSIGMY